ncbi:MAG TPA: DUF3343 domain-containing protein [Bellilinea sp.]|nr:DUF3343 domain-containing protein [Bellilinea sp.]
MTSISYHYFLVESASHALRIEKALITAGIQCKLIPVPRTLSTDCGFSVRINTRDAVAAAEILERKGVPFNDLVTTD